MTLQTSTSSLKCPTQLSCIYPTVPRHWLILVPAPWRHMMSPTLFGVEQLWSHLTVLPHQNALFFQNGPNAFGKRRVCRKFRRQLRDNGGWESFVPSAPVRCPKGAGVRQALIPRDLVSSSESCWLIWSKNLALRLNRWGKERTVYCAKSVGKQKLQKSPNLDFGQGASVSNATLDERSKFCWHELKSRISKIGRM